MLQWGAALTAALGQWGHARVGDHRVSEDHLVGF